MWGEEPDPIETPVPQSRALEKNPSKLEESTQPTASEPISYQPVVTEPATPKSKQVVQIPAVPNSLPSQVDDTLGACPR